LNNTQKGEFLFIIHSESMEISFLEETQLPALEGRSDSVKDSVIPLLPYQLCIVPAMSVFFVNFCCAIYKNKKIAILSAVMLYSVYS
jgi:hypothetical protein